MEEKTNKKIEYCLYAYLIAIIALGSWYLYNGFTKYDKWIILKAFGVEAVLVGIPYAILIYKARKRNNQTSK